jgi:catechol 2,3-dioxygenase-like lactoylglutathione lyase family enzyme
MELSIQANLVNVSDLDISIEFYREVFDFSVVSRRDGVAAMLITENQRSQVLMLRDVTHRARHGGGRDIGIKVLVLEAGSLDELTEIEKRLEKRNAITSVRTTEEWKGVFGIDPDRTVVAVSASVTGDHITKDHWEVLDDIVFSLG